MSEPGFAPSEFCDAEEAARILGFAPATLEKWRTLGTGPRFFRHGRRVRYTYADIREWMNANPSNPELQRPAE